MKLYCTKCEQMKCIIGELVCEDCASKINCCYCGKPISLDESKKVNIWVNRGQKEMQFCSNDCASYYQMGAEG